MFHAKVKILKFIHISQKYQKKDSHGNVHYKWTTLCFFIWRDTKIICTSQIKMWIIPWKWTKGSFNKTTFKNMMGSWWCCIWWICFILDTFITCYNIYVAGNWGQSVGMFCYCLCSLSHLPWFLLGRRKCVDTITLDGNYILNIQKLAKTGIYIKWLL